MLFSRSKLVPPQAGHVTACDIAPGVYNGRSALKQIDIEDADLGDELGQGQFHVVSAIEVIEHLDRGLPLVDTRLGEFHRGGTIPGARWLCHEEVREHLDELDPGVPTVFFCNGPQCTATPDAIRKLLDAGYPAGAILYYRGGIHDWVTLGYPVIPGQAASDEPFA